VCGVGSVIRPGCERIEEPGARIEEIGMAMRMFRSKRAVNAVRVLGMASPVVAVAPLGWIGRAGQSRLCRGRPSRSRPARGL
jgi:hypothetical protein